MPQKLGILFGLNDKYDPRKNIEYPIQFVPKRYCRFKIPLTEGQLCAYTAKQQPYHDVNIKYFFKAMDQLDHVTLVIAITVLKAVQKIIIEMNFRYQTDVNRSVKKICLVHKICFSY